MIRFSARALLIALPIAAYAAVLPPAAFSEIQVRMRREGAKHGEYYDSYTPCCELLL